MAEWKAVLCEILCLAALFSVSQQAVPVCTPDVHFVTKDENVVVGTEVFTLSTVCSDADGDTLTYTKIDSGNTNDFFQLNTVSGTSTGKIEFKKSPDAEDVDGNSVYTSPFTLIVEVTDSTSPGPIKVAVVVYINTLNEHTPAISNLNNPTIAENTAVGTIVGTCDVTDADYSGSDDATVKLSITGGNSLGHFAIRSDSCKVTLIKPLDYETTTSFELVIQAVDSDASPLTSSATLTITVSDVNDNAPDCTQTSLFVAVADGSTAGTTVASLTCTDVDGGSLNYAVLSGDTTRLQIPVGTVGDVTLVSAVDTEAADTWLSVVIGVSDSTATVQTTTVTLSVVVEDIDDNVPYFTAAPYALTVSETATLGTIVATLTTTDADGAGTPSTITYAWAAGCANANKFILDTNTGNILVADALTTADSGWSCSAEIYSGTSTGSKNTGLVTITVTAVNADVPVFKEGGNTVTLYQASVTEGAYPTSGVVTTVTATDSDTPISFALVTSNTPFGIDSSTGVLSQLLPVDYETATAYLLVIRATDSGTPTGTSTAYIRVSVTPVNDFDPSITAIATQTVSELDAPGALITTVTATDSDVGDDGVIRYSLKDTNVPFILEPVSGQLLVADGLDADTTTAYVLEIIATDQSNTTARSSSISLTVSVTDSNDNAPVCNSVGDIIITPDTNIGTFIAQLICTDADSSTQNIRYTEASGDTNDYFLINNINGEIRVRSANTAPGTYNIMVSVTDGGSNALLTTTVPLVIKVEVSLAFSNEPLTSTLVENAAIGTTIMTLTATGAYDAITYSIVSGDTNSNFHLDQSSGALILRKAVDRETLSSYSLVVRATTTNSKTVDSTLDLTISDYNDQTPTYANSYQTYTFAETIGTPTLVANLVATDGDLATNALVDYSILSGNENSMFIYGKSGNLFIMSSLDYETTQAHTLVLAATDRGTPKLTGTTIVYIVVTNAIDNTPQIVPTGGLTLTYLPEDTTVGTSIFQIDAGTVDAGVERTYAITSGNYDTAGNVAFYINENNGTIFLAYPLDREKDTGFSLGIQVSNTNNDVATATLTITVYDINDNDPAFDSGNYVFEVPHNTALGTTVGTLIITDPDDGANGTPVLSIFSGDTNNHFTIQGFSIEVAATLLDANTLNEYNLVVTATDGGNPSRATNATVKILVADEFKTPTFNPTNATTTVDETQTPGLLVYNCDATYAGAVEGTAETGDLYYSFTAGNGDAKFFIEPFSGIIQLVGNLDFATTPVYTLTIQGANINQVSIVATFTLTVSVNQINQVTPEFGSKLYQFTVIESDAAGTAVGTVAATDTDVGNYGTVSYSLETTSNFLIDNTTGAITTNGVFEYSNDKSFHLEVYAIDDASTTSRTGTSVVIVSVTDTNNHAPTFAGSPYTFDVNEAHPPGSPMLVLAGSDLDYGAFGTLTYVITAGNDNGNFSINDTTGVLSMAASVDYEGGPRQYVLTVEAYDGGTPSLTGNATVTINVLDYNDEPPVFNNTRVEVSLNDTTAFLSTIWTVTATDVDSTAWHYSIQSGNTNGLFAIDVDTGIIQAVASLQNIASDFYDLIVIAVDNGAPQLTGTTTVAVTVQPVINPGTTDYTMNVDEGQAAPVLVGTINGIGALGVTSSFTITGGNIASAFTVNALGEIYTNAVLDTELIPLYKLTVDIVASVSNATYTVRIDVNDINDNAPVFEPCPVFFSLVENYPAGNTIGTISVTDADGDVTTNGAYTLSFESPFYDSFFTLDATTGVLTADRAYNKEGAYNHFEFNVLATDSGTPPSTSTCSVTVSIIDVVEVWQGDNGEVVDYSAFMSVEIPHDLAVGSLVYTMTKDDFNMTDRTGAAEFKSATNEMNGQSSFSVDGSTGAITVSDNLFMYGKVTTYFHWCVCKVDGRWKVGLIRIDTFDKNDNMVAVVTSNSAADVEAARATLLTNLQAKFTSPVSTRIFEVRTTDRDTSSTTGRKKRSTTESAMMVVAVADSSVDELKNVDVTKTFLSQSAVLAALQSSSDGTPVTGLDTGTSITVTSVDPYDDGTKSLEETPVSDDRIISMVAVGGSVGFIIMIGAIIFISWCCLKTRNAYLTDEERIADMEWVPETEDGPTLEEIEEEKARKKAKEKQLKEAQMRNFKF